MAALKVDLGQRPINYAVTEDIQRCEHGSIEIRTEGLESSDLLPSEIRAFREFKVTYNKKQMPAKWRFRVAVRSFHFQKLKLLLLVA